MRKREQYVKTVYRPYPPLFVSIILIGAANPKYYREVIREPYAIQGMIQSGGVWHYLKKDMSRAGELGLKNWLDSKKLVAAKRVFFNREQAFLRAAAGLNFGLFCQTYEAYMPALIIVWLTENLVEKYIRDRLAKKLTPGEVDDLMDILNIPMQDNFYKQEELELAQARDLAKHVKKWAWIKSRYGDTRSYTIQEARAKRAQINKKKFLTDYHAEKIKLRRIIKRAKAILGGAADAIDLMQYVVYYRTQRTDIMNQAQYLFVPGLKKLAAAKGLTYQQLLHCAKDEILGRLPSLKEIKSRQKDFAIILEKRLVRCVSGKEANEIRDWLCEDVGNASEVKGAIAYKGKAQGTVRLIFSTADFAKVKIGDILVTSMTNPHMVPIMKKAAAFVTDEGGITCHAAILSRELKKPCVIGTKIATQILKDGDKVAVDADKGTICKLK